MSEITSKRMRLTRGFTFLATATEKEEMTNAAAFTEAISAHLGGRAPHGAVLTGSAPGSNADMTKVRPEECSLEIKKHS
ncbi:hypothetical protein SK128_024744 [Halocaridina rubra]|uniref:Uncharacterized protein n=1 Tax=Halocaridina rubra TaxID=373956 RepID=A0AAN8WH24_HALRR